MTTIPNNKRIAIIGGGTNTYISNHLALSAPAYGTTAVTLEELFNRHPENKMNVDLYLTKMADPSKITNPQAPDTPEEVAALVDKLVANPDTRVIIFNVAMVDYKPTSLFNLESNAYDAYNPVEITDKFGKYSGRLNTSKLPEVCLELSVQDKIIQKIRKERKDILLVGFKTTCGATKEEQFNKGLKLCKDASANIVFVNDVDKDRIEKLNKHLKASNDVTLRHYINNVKIELDDESNIKKELWKKAKIKNMEAIEKLQNNGLVTPEESSYWYNTRDEALDALVQMVLDRSHLHFTRSTVVDSETVPWQTTRRVPGKVYTLGKVPPENITKGPREVIPNPLIPETFRTVFDWVRSQGAYKKGPTGSTVGHFGIALGPNEFLTSKRKTDFNKIEEVGLVRVITDDPDDVFGYKHFFDISKTPVNELLDPLEKKVVESYKDKVIAFGAKPSVGGQSQRTLFETFPDLNCIVHFHCPLKPESRELFNPVQQFGVECGSMECGQNTAMNMKEFKLSSGRSVWAVHLDHHGPNIIFNSATSDPQEIIEFIETHWLLDKKTTGLSDELI